MWWLWIWICKVHNFFSHLCLQRDLKMLTKAFSTSGDKALELYILKLWINFQENILFRKLHLQRSESSQRCFVDRMVWIIWQIFFNQQNQINFVLYLSPAWQEIVKEREKHSGYKNVSIRRQEHWSLCNKLFIKG